MAGNFRQHIQCGEPVLDRPAFDRTHAECICWFIYFLFVSARLPVFCHVICMFTSATLCPLFPSVPTFLLVSWYIPSLPFSPITFSFSIPTSLPPCLPFPIYLLPLKPAKGPISAQSYAQLPIPMHNCGNTNVLFKLLRGPPSGWSHPRVI